MYLIYKIDNQFIIFHHKLDRNHYNFSIIRYQYHHIAHLDMKRRTCLYLLENYWFYKIYNCSIQLLNKSGKNYHILYKHYYQKNSHLDNFQNIKFHIIYNHFYSSNNYLWRRHCMLHNQMCTLHNFCYLYLYKSHQDMQNCKCNCIKSFQNYRTSIVNLIFQSKFRSQYRIYRKYYCQYLYNIQHRSHQHKKCLKGILMYCKNYIKLKVSQSIPCIMNHRFYINYLQNLPKCEKDIKSNSCCYLRRILISKLDNLLTDLCMQHRKCYIFSINHCFRNKLYHMNLNICYLKATISHYRKYNYHLNHQSINYKLDYTVDIHLSYHYCSINLDSARHIHCHINKDLLYMINNLILIFHHMYCNLYYKFRKYLNHS